MILVSKIPLENKMTKDPEYCIDKHRNINRAFAIIFTVLSLLLTATTWSIYAGWMSKIEAAAVSARLDVWQATRLEQIKNTEVILAEIKLELRELNIEVRRLSLELNKKDSKDINK